MILIYCVQEPLWVGDLTTAGVYYGEPDSKWAPSDLQCTDCVWIVPGTY